MVLCIDTATADSGISLVSSDKSLGYIALEQMNASENIIKSIDKLISQSNISLSDLKGVMVIKGPGSFTGLRVGISVANQFAHQLKIPIIGLTTDEWYKYRTDEKDFVYLQTMNRDEVYMVVYGDIKTPPVIPDPNPVIPTPLVIPAQAGIYPLQKIIDTNKPFKYLGQLSDVHREKLSHLDEITELRSPEDTWKKAVQSIFNQNYKKYDLIEPFYGKEPTITKSKK